jgi:hypothetical protein
MPSTVRTAARQSPPAAVAPGQVTSTEAGAGPFVLNWSSLSVAALLAAGAITLYMLALPRWLGIEEMDIGITIGRLVDPSGGIADVLARVAWHVGNGLIYIPVYAVILVRLRRQSSAWTGMVFGVCLWLVGPMLLVPVLLDLNPLVRSGALTNPGVFMLPLGLGWVPAIVDLGAHLTHGILAGVMYKH